MTSSSSARTYARTLVILLPYVWIIYHNLNVLFSLSPYDTLGSSKHYEEQMLSTPWKDPYSSSSKKDDDSKLNERLSLLEDKLHAYLGYGGTGDPFLSTKISAPCKELSHLQDYCDSIPLGLNPDNCAPNVASPICLDDFPYNNCTVYDFGIREQPYFGVILSRHPFNCKVYAFDPSPITRKWYESPAAKDLRENSPNYKLFLYGGGYQDENLNMLGYNWGQVSIYQYPNMILDPNNCTSNGRCQFKRYDSVQEKHQLPVRSVPSVMKELGHTQIDVLKLDVEGSEYRMLEALFENPEYCRMIQQITLEWHHFEFDIRYGASSVPYLNLMYKLLQRECGLEQFWDHDGLGWPNDEKLYADMKLVLMYNLAAFRKVPPAVESQEGQ